MRKVLILLIFLFLIVILSFLFANKDNKKITTPIGNEIQKIREKPFEKYSYENLKVIDFKPVEIEIGKVVKEGENYTSRMFYFTFDPSINSGKMKKISGLINIPNEEEVYPVIVQFRGYAEQENYSSGSGTRHSGEFFASNGFIILAPDFLGYGESDKASDSSLEDRFQTQTTALTLLASIKNLNHALENNEDVKARADVEKIGIWGHSNGGQISLTTLEISGKNYPTVLWNPVSKPFPYSVLFFTDDFEDHGKALRRVIAKFEEDYDIEKYSLTNYLDWIDAPIQLHQGVEDKEVPMDWSDELNEKITSLNKNIDYYIYPGEDHNFAKGSWNTAIERSITFYQKNFNK